MPTATPPPPPACSTPPATTPPSSTPRPSGCCARRSTGSRPRARRGSPPRCARDDWYADFIEFLARERAFATLLTPARDAGGRPRQALGHRAQRRLQRDPRLLRAALLVRVAGHDPRARPDLAERQRRGPPARGASCSSEGAVFAFGLSEREHGADIYSTDMVLTPDGDGGFRATGGKYYIGNGNVAGMVSVFGRRADVEGPDGYVFFAADSPHPAYKLIKNVVHAQMYVSAFELEDYPVRRRGRPAHRRRGVRGGAQHDQRRQVQPRLLLDRDGRALLLRDGHPGRGPGPVRQARDRVRPGPADPLRGLRPPAGGQALRRAGGRLRAQREPRGPPLPALHADQQDAGDDGGRAHRAPARRGDLGEGLRARLLLRRARRTSSTGCPSSRAPST